MAQSDKARFQTPRVTASDTPSTLPRPDFHFPGEVGRTYLDSDPAQFPQPVQAPKGAPNIVLILIDDCGFGQFGTFGGGIPSPTMDRLAAEGLRYNRFHTTALCSPTRAALITGRNHHSAAFAGITEVATGYDGYTCILPRSCGTVGEVLRQNGYMTAWIGKNHNTPTWETSAAGPFDRWANGLGFDYFYGFNAGDMNHWNPILYENRNLVPRVDRSELPPDHRHRRQGDRLGAPGQKHLARIGHSSSTSPPAPPTRRTTRRRNGSTSSRASSTMGWDKYREQTLERQKKLGVVPQDTKLTVRSKGLPAWDSLNADQKRLYARMMEVFAGYGAHCDYEMGRVVDAVKQLPDADNTLDHLHRRRQRRQRRGRPRRLALREPVLQRHSRRSGRTTSRSIDELGGPKHFNHFPSAWAHAMNTPFQWTKQVASHFGGTRNPMIISWPAQIKDKGGLRTQFLHVIDIVPTLYERLRHHRADRSQRRAAEADRGYQLRLHVRRREGRRAVARRSTSSWAATAASTTTAGWRRRLSFVPWEPDRERLRPRQAPSGSSTTSIEDFSQANDLAKQVSRKAAAASGPLVGRGGKVQRPAARLARRDRLNAEADGPPEPDRRTHQDDVLSRHHRPSRRRLAADVQQIVDDHRRHRSPRRQERTA